MSVALCTQCNVRMGNWSLQRCTWCGHRPMSGRSHPADTRRCPRLGRELPKSKRPRYRGCRPALLTAQHAGSAAAALAQSCGAAGAQGRAPRVAAVQRWRPGIEPGTFQIFSLTLSQLSYRGRLRVAVALLVQGRCAEARGSATEHSGWVPAHFRKVPPSRPPPMPAAGPGTSDVPGAEVPWSQTCPVDSPARKQRHCSMGTVLRRSGCAVGSTPCCRSAALPRPGIEPGTFRSSV